VRGARAGGAASSAGNYSHTGSDENNYADRGSFQTWDSQPHEG